MVMIPQNTNTTEHQIESKEYGGEQRPYLGMSGIGNECVAALWFSFHWTTKTKHIARKERIFRRGDIEESRIIHDLKSIGIDVFRRDKNGIAIPISGKRNEQEELIGFAGHSKGHPDGRALGIIEAPKTEHLLEFKTMSEKSFGILIDNGIEEGFPAYWGQLHRYMGAMKLKRAMFIATNKNNEARKYIRVRFDKEKYEELIQKERIVILNELPFRPQFSSDFYKCGWCSHYNTCHFGKAPERNCRTCKFHEIHEEGKWACGIDGIDLSVEKQRKGCNSYRRLF